MEDIFGKLKQAVKQRKEQSEQHYKEESKERLFQIIKKKLETTFIGDIAAIEQAFGELWGDQYHQDDLTKEEIEMRKKWATLRNNILDRGNAQIRAIRNELEQHTVCWEGYSYKFKVKDNG